MDPGDALTEDGAFKVNTLRWLEGPEFGDGYRFADDLPLTLSDTGLLEVFRVVSDDPQKRQFRGRWDRKVDKTSSVESGQRMKVYLVPRPDEPNPTFASEDESFKHGREGFVGHYPEIRDITDGWTYRFDIRDRGGVLVLRGTLAIGIARKIHLGRHIRA